MDAYSECFFVVTAVDADADVPVVVILFVDVLAASVKSGTTALTGVAVTVASMFTLV